MTEETHNLAEIVREALDFQFPTPSPREDVIESLPTPASFNLVHIISVSAGQSVARFIKNSQLLNYPGF